MTPREPGEPTTCGDCGTAIMCVERGESIAWICPECVYRRMRALAQLEYAACNFARSRAHAADLWARMIAMPSCAVVAAWEARVKAYCDADGPESGEPPTACHRSYDPDQYEGDRLRPRQAWCGACLARQPIFDQVLAERRKWGGYTRAILAAARKLGGL